MTIFFLGCITNGLFYVWMIAMYYRKWYAFLLAPVLLVVYFSVISVIWFRISEWLGYRYQIQEGPAEGLGMLLTLIGGLLGVIVGSVIGTAVGQYIEFRFSKPSDP